MPYDDSNMGYAWEKLMSAVMGMAQSPESIRQRLVDAFVFNLIHIDPENDLAPDLRDKYKYIADNLTNVAATGDEGDVMATAITLSDGDAANLASKIVSLYDEVSARYR